MFATTIKHWSQDPNSILTRLGGGWFSYDRYFNSIATSKKEIIGFTHAFAKKGIDYYMFKEDYTSLLEAEIRRYSGRNNLVIPVTAQKYSIFTQYYKPNMFDTIIAGSADRSLKFKVFVDSIVPVENNMMRVDIEISDPIGYASKDREVWNHINSTERMLIENANDPDEERYTHTQFAIKTCKGLDRLKPEYKNRCNQVTHDSSGLCDWCFKLEAGDFDDDFEPDYSELDQGAEDEAEYYMQLDRDIEIAQGNIPNF